MRFKYLVAVFTICLVQIAFIASCSESIESKLIGEWEGTDGKGRLASIVFEEDSTYQLIQDNNIYRSSTPDKLRRWRIDVIQKPMHLDLVEMNNSDTLVFPGIFRFITEDKICNPSKPTGPKPL